MAKRRAPRQVLGHITRKDGVRVEVKNPTIYTVITEQAQALELQRQVIEQLQGTLAKVEADRDRMKRAFGWLADHWWSRLGFRLRLMPDGIPAEEPVKANPLLERAEPSSAAA